MSIELLISITIYLTNSNNCYTNYFGCRRLECKYILVHRWINMSYSHFLLRVMMRKMNFGIASFDLVWIRTTKHLSQSISSSFDKARFGSGWSHRSSFFSWCEFTDTLGNGTMKAIIWQKLIWFCGLLITSFLPDK